jgi:alpha-L-fucosidase
MIRRLFHAVLVAVFVAAISFLSACEASEQASAEEVVTDVEWFRDAKFGMFIHWGMSSQLGGIWDGKRYYGITEWLMRRAKIPSAEYKAKSVEFNPVEYDAAEWVAVAKAAGVRYIVITAKHHDGFAMFDSAVSDFDIVDATPYGEDPLKALTEEARKAGIRIGFYYSQYQDWTEKDAAGNEWEFDPDDRNFDRYLAEKAMPQLEELLTNYGPIDIIWFDTPGDLSKENAEQLRAWVKELQPNCLVSDRIGHDLGDYKGYNDGEIPAVAEGERPWEAIFTHNDSWGFSYFDYNFKSTSEVLELLISTVSKGGNLMLNIGPDGLGRIPAPSAATFRSVGEWLKVNGEAVYGTSASPLGKVPWGGITARPGKLYLHVLHPPADGMLILPGLATKPDAARVLATGEKLKVRRDGGDIFVELPASEGSSVPVVAVDLAADTAIEVDDATAVSARYDGARLQFEDLDGGDAELAKYRTMHYFGDWKHYHTVGGLTSPANSATWNLRVLEPGTYKIVLNYSASKEQAGQEGVLTIAGRDFYFKVLETGELSEGEAFSPRKPLMFLDHPVAVVHFDQAGDYELTVRPEVANTSLAKLLFVDIRLHD